MKNFQSISWVKNDAGKYKMSGDSSIIFQFRKNSFATSEKKLSFDVFNLFLSNLEESSNHFNYEIDRLAYTECVENALVYAMNVSLNKLLKNFKRRIYRRKNYFKFSMKTRFDPN